MSETSEQIVPLTEATRLSLYGLTRGMDELMTKVAEAGGELTPELEAMLAELETMLVSKVDSCVGWRQSQLDLVQAIANRIKDFEELQERIENRVKKFDEYVRGCVERRENKKLIGKMATVSIKKAVETVEIFDEGSLPAEYIHTPQPESKPMKKEIAKALKEGHPVPGARLVRGPGSLQYKLAAGGEE